MRPARHHLAGILGLVLLVFFGLLAAKPTSGRLPSPPPDAERPRLAVLLVFDQLRGDYLPRWQHLFGPGGFRRLAAEGAWFGNCHYPYSDTVTGAGHASVATGCSPCRHGIIGNDWYDRTAHEPVYCVGSVRDLPVPPRPLPTGERRKNPGIAPRRLLAPTLADALKEATEGAARVVSLSFKDRSAVLPGGQRPDVCCWFDATEGRFETSTYYADALPRWVAEFNRGPEIGRWFGVPWQRLLPDFDYAGCIGPDDASGEGYGFRQGRTFPHPTGGVPLALAPTYYSALYNSPFGNEVLANLARRAVEAEGLGSHSTPDLLCVSFSSNDSVGHCWGPDSQEVLDITLRTDRLLADFLTFLDHHVGRGRYVVAVTADHGVCPLPEVSKARGKDAGRLPADLLSRRAEDFLQRTFGGPSGSRTSGTPERWIEYAGEGWVYLDRATIARHHLYPGDVEAALAGWLQEQPGIQAAYTRTRLLQGLPTDDAIGQRVLRSFYPERSGNITVINRPYWILWKQISGPLREPTGTTHGSPHPYDTHVPLLVSGPGINTGAYADRVAPQAAAVLLARSLGIPPPAAADATIPDGVLMRKR